MKFIVDELPDAPKECPFYRNVLWINDCIRRSEACSLSKEKCDLAWYGCQWLKQEE